MKCMVLGGGGFIGSHLVDALLTQGASVTVLDRPNLRRYRPFEAHEKVRWIEADALNPAEWQPAIAGIDVVYHLVSTTLPRSSNDDPGYDVESNLVRTLRLLDMFRQHGVKRVVFASSGGTVYGVPVSLPIAETAPTDPLCSYGIVKLAIEKYLELYRILHGLEYRVLRISNPYGERQNPAGSQGAVTVFLDKAMRREPIHIWGDGSVVRDFIHVDDVVRALVCAGGSRSPSRVFNVGSGQGLSVRDLLTQIEQVLGRPIDRVYEPARRFDVPASVLDIRRAAAEWGWQPAVDIGTGLVRTLAWLESSANASHA